MQHLFGEKLRALRIQSHMTQAELAQKLGLATQSHLSYLENGKSAPSIALAVRAALVLSVAVDYLLRDTIPVSPPIISSLSSWDDDVVRQFGKRLRNLRTQRSMSQMQLAEHLSPLSQAHISFLETGRKAPSIEIVLRCADLFGVTADDLLRPDSANHDDHTLVRSVHE